MKTYLYHAGSKIEGCMAKRTAREKTQTKPLVTIKYKYVCSEIQILGEKIE